MWKWFPFNNFSNVWQIFMKLDMKVHHGIKIQPKFDLIWAGPPGPWPSGTLHSALVMCTYMYSPPPPPPPKTVLALSGCQSLVRPFWEKVWDPYYILLKSNVTSRDHMVRCRGSKECGSCFVYFACKFHRRWRRFCITLKSTTLLFMCDRNVWTTKPWQWSKWPLDFNSI